jgi:hypothetical protein
MGVVRINDEIQNKIKKFIKKEDNKYKYPSISSFINNAILEKLKNGK